MRTLLVDTGRLGALRMRTPFRLLADKGGQPIPNRAGEPIWIAEAVAPGFTAAQFAGPDTVPMPRGLRLKQEGGTCPTLDEDDWVQLGGKVTITSRTHAQGRGMDATVSTGFTLSAESYTPGAPSALTGRWFPVRLPGDKAPEMIGVTALERGGFVAHLMLPPGTFEDVADVALTAAPSEDLILARVTADFEVRLYEPATGDESRNNKAGMTLIAAQLRRADAPPAAVERPRRNASEPSSEAVS